MLNILFYFFCQIFKMVLFWYHDVNNFVFISYVAIVVEYVIY